MSMSETEQDIADSLGNDPTIMTTIVAPQWMFMMLFEVNERLALIYVAKGEVKLWAMQAEIIETYMEATDRGVSAMSEAARADVDASMRINIRVAVFAAVFATLPRMITLAEIADDGDPGGSLAWECLRHLGAQLPPKFIELTEQRLGIKVNS